MSTPRRFAIVCFEDPRHVTGGVQRRVAAEIEYFAQRGSEVVVITAGDGEETFDGGIRYIPVSTPNVVYPIRTLLFSWKASRLLRRMSPIDLIEAHHDAGAAVLFAYPSRLPRTTAFVHVIHGVFRDEFSAVRRYEGVRSRATIAASGLLPLSIIEQGAAVRADAVITVSRYGAEQVARLYRVPADRIHVVPNGIDLDSFFPDAKRQTRGLPGTDCDVLYVGRFHARKGVLLLLRSFVLAHAHNLNLRLTLAGDGPLLPLLREEVERNALGDVVTFLGAVTDREILDAYHGADIVCVPSLQEGQGIVALEAQACGIPVVATRAGGLAEAVQDGVTGLLVPRGDEQALTDALLTLSRNANLRREMSRNAAESARSFAWGATLDRCHGLYGNLIDTLERGSSRYAEVCDAGSAPRIG